VSKKVLFISYYTPPLATSGVIRITKLAKYLLRYNWQPIILTTQPISYYHYDYELQKDLEGIKIYRSETFDSGRLLYLLRIFKPRPRVEFSRLSLLLNFVLFPDARRFWIPFATRKGKEIIKKEKPDLIFATAPPFSSLIAGLILKRTTGLPLIADFRDPWPTGYIPPPKGRKNRIVALRKLIVNSSARVLAVNETIKKELNFSPTIILPNGYDPEEFTVPPVRLPGINIVHTGNISDVSDQLALMAQSIKDCSEIKLTLAGPGAPEIINKLLKEFGNINYLGVKSHKDTVQIIKGAEILLYISKPNQGIGIKLYEYFGAQKPILAICEEKSEVQQLIKAHNVGLAVPLEKQRIKQAVLSLISRQFLFSPQGLEEYNFLFQAEKLARLFNEVTT
jgi:hypothetical protein